MNLPHRDIVVIREKASKVRLAYHTGLDKR